MKLLKFLLIILLSTQLVSENNKNLSYAPKIHSENIVKAYFPDKKTAQKALITYHNYLLESHLDEGYLILDLPLHEQKRISNFGFTLQSDKKWLQQWLEAKSNFIQLNADSSYSTTANSFSCYPTVEETYQQVAQLAADYPLITDWIDIGNSWEKTANMGGYDIKVLKITNKEISTAKPVLFIQGVIHAREMTPGMLTLDFAKLLLTGYGIDADATWLIDQQETHIIFLLNPDGRKKAEQQLFWRKNTNQAYCSSTSNDRGADLNRNFSFFWNQGKGGSSPKTCDETFRGASASSEPEVRAVESYIRSIIPDSRGNNDTDAAPLETSGLHIDVHSYGELVLWPWGHSTTESPNDSQLKTLARRIAAFNGYAAMRSIGLYTTNGTSDNISYGELGIAALTLELGTTFFETCTSYEASVKHRNLDALLYAAKITAAPYLLPEGPTTSEIELVSSSSNSLFLSAKINDSRFLEATPGFEPRHNIVAADYSIDIPFNSNSVSPVALSAEDNSFDSNNELVTVEIDISNITPGRHQLYLRGQDESGAWGPQSSIFMDIGNLPPSPRISARCNQLDCNFNASNSSDDGTIVSYLWDFGDGTTSTSVEVDHSFSTSSIQTVVLSVTDNQGQTQQLSRQIKSGTPLQPPTVSFIKNCNANSCQFDGNSSSDTDGNIVSYLWNFGDGGTSTGVATNHDYQRLGYFQVSLTVVDNDQMQAAESSALNITSLQPSSTSPSGGSGGIFNLAFLIIMVSYWWIMRTRK